jgi:drug/metabolite transporter (DMT)-like permease
MTSSPVTAPLERPPAPSPPEPAHARASRLRLLAAFAAVYAIWGSTYLGIRIAIETFPPLLMAGTRHLIAGALLYPWIRRRSGIVPTAANWRACALTGFLLLLCGNGGVSWAEQVVPSGVAALLVATVSLWMVLIEWLRPRGAHPGPRVFGGLALGFAGLVLLVGPANLAGSGRVNLVGAGVLFFASLCWAAGSVFSKHIALPHSPLLAVAMQSLTGGAFLWVAGLVSGEGAALSLSRVSLRSTLALVYLIVFGSWIGFTAYNYLLKATTPARVGTYAFVNPVVALFLGWALAGEAVTLRTFSAAAVILTGVVLVITAPHPPPHSEDECVPSPGEA